MQVKASLLVPNIRYVIQQKELSGMEMTVHDISYMSKMRLLTFVGLGDGAFVGFAMPPVSTMSVGFPVGTFVPRGKRRSINNMQQKVE